MKRLTLMIACLLAACGEPAATVEPEFEAAELEESNAIADALVLSVVPTPLPLAPVEDVVDGDAAPAVALSYLRDEPAAQWFLDLVNEERAGNSLPPLKVYWDLEDDAHAQTERMIDAGHIYHNPDLGTVTGPVWSRLGENVGVGGGVETLHAAFMNSPGHRANVLGDYTHIGIGAQREPQSRLWVTFVFMKSTVPGIERTLGPFVDDDFHTHEHGISRVAAAGITVGCDSTGRRFCPDAPVTRGQMATFLTRAFGLPPSATNHFTDDDGAWYERPANALADSGITKGCNNAGTLFCGDDHVTRGQMAVFLARALNLGPASADYFDDDTGQFYEASANRMYESGITRGCGARSYCGTQPVTRGEMATFLTRALGL